ncbi:hypothetical protein EYZ11_012017 [Aspergillus tanneri]|uniref:Uncharacterized protein n=1 Tax=Aspergillus tanneri TaxID=1220188 RepID=A0A4S3J1B2_9EURO|nr:hypothetical protein EYZ11_012017 [Aspergillus tanneri]
MHVLFAVQSTKGNGYGVEEITCFASAPLALEQCQKSADDSNPCRKAQSMGNDGHS